MEVRRILASSRGRRGALKREFDSFPASVEKETNAALITNNLEKRRLQRLTPGSQALKRGVAVRAARFTPGSAREPVLKCPAYFSLACDASRDVLTNERSPPNGPRVFDVSNLTSGF